jgi:hypothetical protein
MYDSGVTSLLNGSVVKGSTFTLKMCDIVAKI